LGKLLDAAEPAAPAEAEWVALVRAVAQGDQRALQQLYERTHRIVFTLAVRLTMNPHTAEEVTVDVFHEVWRRAAAYDPADGSVVGWIMNQARSRAIDRVRHDHRQKRTPTEAEQLPRQAVEGADESLVSREEAQRLRDALSCLTPLEREAIEVAFFSELTYAETAGRLDQPISTIKSRIRAGLTRLRQTLKGR
jgi:RNA polymerase sigma-70 factor (ECF subfamily)